MKQRVVCNRGGGADGDPPLKSCSCVCCAELVFSCTDGSGNWLRESSWVRTSKAQLHVMSVVPAPRTTVRLDVGKLLYPWVGWALYTCHVLR